MNQNCFIFRLIILIACFFYPAGVYSQDTVFNKGELILINGNRISGKLFFDNFNSSTNGITIRPFLQLGIGLSFDMYEQASVMPCFISISGNMLNGQITPYYYMHFGISKAWENETYSYD